MPWVGFEPTISAGERPKTYALDRTATGTGKKDVLSILIASHTSLLAAATRLVGFDALYVTVTLTTDA